MIINDVDVDVVVQSIHCLIKFQPKINGNVPNQIKTMKSEYFYHFERQEISFREATTYQIIITKLTCLCFVFSDVNKMYYWNEKHDMNEIDYMHSPE